MTPEPDTADLIALETGTQALAELPVTASAIEDLDRAVNRRIFLILERGDPLSPEIAVQAWVEKLTYSRLIKRLTQRVRMGQTAGENLAPHMDEKE